MKGFWVLAALACAAAISTTRAVEAQKGPRLIEITVGDTMKYSIETIDAKPGESLKVRLTSNGTMPKTAMGHNFVLLKPATDPLAFVNAGLQHRDTDFIDPAMKTQTIASTKLVGPGETVETIFKAPAKPGSYTYLCSFPGHFAGGMKGTLVVK